MIADENLYYRMIKEAQQSFQINRIQKMNLRNLKFSLLFFIAASTLLAQTAAAQDWARNMFTQKKFVHDFKNVPLGEIPEHRFEIQNIYKEDIRIRSISSSCGCTIASATKNVLKTWEKGEILCRFNTPAVGSGFKTATITVLFDRPFVGEVQLTVRGTIVTGVSFSPESLEFGQVSDSNRPRKTVRLSSPGNPNLRIHDVKSKSQHITVFSPQRVASTGNSAVFEMTAQLKSSVPKGYNKGELYVIVEENPANRPNNQPILRQIPLKFSAKVVSPLQLAPEILTLGSIEPGEKISQKIFLTSEMPFKITDVRCQSGAFSVRAEPDARKVHIVEVSYVGEQKLGRHENQLSFYTDLDSKAAGRMTAVVEIVDPNSAEAE